MANNYDKFLQIVVNSKVRIKHIKKKKKGNYLDGCEAILYSQKMTLLYRIILFEILGIDSSIYQDNICKLVNSLDMLNGALESFLIKVK